MALIYQDSVKILVYWIFPVIIFLAGFAGNFAGIYSYRRKKNFIRIGPKKVFFYFFIVDTIYLSISLKLFLQNGFGINMELNLVWCKIYTYISYSLSSIPIWLTVYVTFERYISFQYPEKGKLLRNQRNQRNWFTFLIISNFIFYIPVFLNNVKKSLASDLKNNFLIQCNYHYKSNLLFMLLLINRMILPFSFSIIFSISLIRFIYKQKANYFIHYSFKECAQYKKEVKAALVSISINLIMILLNLPLFIVHFFFLDLTSLYLFTFYLFLLNYGVKYYLIILANRIFYDGFIKLILRQNSRFIPLIDIKANQRYSAHHNNCKFGEIAEKLIYGHKL